MDYAIISFNETKNGIDFNKAILDTPQGEFSLSHLTKKGYYSKKPLFIDIDFVKGSECGQSVLYISKETADMLKEKYTTKGKLWKNPYDTGISRALAIANHCTKNGGDIYDRG